MYLSSGAAVLFGLFKYPAVIKAFGGKSWKEEEYVV